MNASQLIRFLPLLPLLVSFQSPFPDRFHTVFSGTVLVLPGCVPINGDLFADSSGLYIGQSPEVSVHDVAPEH